MSITRPETDAIRANNREWSISVWVSSFENSEVTWLVYPFEKGNAGFAMSKPEVRFTEWDSVLMALREGEPLNRDEILGEVVKKRRKYKLPTLNI